MLEREKQKKKAQTVFPLSFSKNNKNKNKRKKTDLYFFFTVKFSILFGVHFGPADRLIVDELHEKSAPEKDENRKSQHLRRTTGKSRWVGDEG